MPATQRKAKVTMTSNALNAERRARGKGRAPSHRPNVRAGASGGEAAARPAECSAEVIKRLRVMARPSLIAARMLARAERNQQLSRDGAAPKSRQAP